MALVVSVAFSALAIYSSNDARKALAGPLYRSRALWTAAIAAYIAVVEVQALLVDLGAFPYSPPYSSSLGGVLFYLLIFGVGLAVIWVWIDRAIAVSLDLDFFHRDLLSWKRGLRYVSGGVWIFAIALGVFTPTAGLLTDILNVLLGAPIVYAAAVVILGFTRVRDALLRGYSKWVGVVVLSLVATGITFPYNFPYVLVGYALYRVATSLSLRDRLGPISGGGLPSSMRIREQEPHRRGERIPSNSSSRSGPGRHREPAGPSRRPRGAG